MCALEGVSILFICLLYITMHIDWTSCSKGSIGVRVGRNMQCELTALQVVNVQAMLVGIL